MKIDADIIALIKWRESLSDFYGEELDRHIKYVLQHLQEEDVPEKYIVALKKFQAMNDHNQEVVIVFSK